MPYPSALKGNPKCIFFTDFDGTITLQDSKSLTLCYRGANADQPGNDMLVRNLNAFRVETEC